jgi:tripartite-type tricarboxylate transporter receptor subunit TctC
VRVKHAVDIIAYLKANPGKISMASGGIGTPAHVSGELFKMKTSVNLVLVPYRRRADLIAGGDIQF